MLLLFIKILGKLILFDQIVGYLVGFSMNEYGMVFFYGEKEGWRGLEENVGVVQRFFYCEREAWEKEI